tara:strand:- start:4115 stop:4912 length:798 start_codon:yes stop_codon:yes gene_type:complete
MHALIDGDIFAYEFGNAKGTSGEQPLPWPFIVSRLDARIANIFSAVGAESSQIYLSGRSNFRVDVATIKPYKGHRPQEKPHWWEKIRDFLVYHRGAIVIDGMEADDILGIEQVNDIYYDMDHPYRSTVICSRDKDLHMIPGWHYTWGAGKQEEQPLWWQNELDAIRFFYTQLLTGDSTDNIPGLYGVGKSSSLVKYISTCSTELEMYAHVREQYEKRFGSYWNQFLIENARLLWILREDGEDVKDRLELLENKHNEELSESILPW